MLSQKLIDQQINLINSIIKNPILNGKEKASNEKMYNTLKALFNKYKVDFNEKQCTEIIVGIADKPQTVKIAHNLIEIRSQISEKSKSQNISEQVSKMPKIKKGLEAAEVEAEKRLSRIKYEPKKASVSNFVSPRYRFPDNLDKELKAKLNNLDTSKRAEAIKALEEKSSKKSSGVNNLKISDYAKKSNKAAEFLASKEKENIREQQTKDENRKTSVAETKYAPKKKYGELAEKILTNGKKQQDEAKYKEGGERSKLGKKTISQDHATSKTLKEAIEKSKSQTHRLNFDFNHAIKNKNFKEAANILEKLDRKDISKHGSKEVKQFIKDYDRLEKHLYREQKFEMFDIITSYSKFVDNSSFKINSDGTRDKQDLKNKFREKHGSKFKEFSKSDMDKILDVAHEAYKMPKAEKSIFSKIVDSCVETFKNVKNKVQGKEINTKIRTIKHDIPKDIQDQLKNALKNQKSLDVEAEPFDAKAKRSEKTKAESVKDREEKARKVKKSK